MRTETWCVWRSERVVYESGAGPDRREMWRSRGSGKDLKRLARRVGIEDSSVLGGRDRATVGNGENDVMRTLVDMSGQNLLELTEARWRQQSSVTCHCHESTLNHTMGLLLSLPLAGVLGTVGSSCLAGLAFCCTSTAGQSLQDSLEEVLTLIV
jgi:hypothetical protein